MNRFFRVSWYSPMFSKWGLINESQNIDTCMNYRLQRTNIIDNRLTERLENSLPHLVNPRRCVKVAHACFINLRHQQEEAGIHLFVSKIILSEFHWSPVGQIWPNSEKIGGRLLPFISCPKLQIKIDRTPRVQAFSSPSEAGWAVLSHLRIVYIILEWFLIWCVQTS